MSNASRLSPSGSTAPVVPDQAALDRAIGELRDGAARWAGLGHTERAALFAATHAAIVPVAREWAELAARAKRLPLDSQLVGEEWMSGPYAALAGAATFANAYRALAAGGTTIDGLRFRTAPGGRIRTRILPDSAQQWVLFHGFSADIWLEPGITEAQARHDAGLGAATPGENGGVGLVLGAGNISAIAPLDAFSELAAHNRASLIKLNPTFASLLPVYRTALAPLIDAGVVRVVTGDGAVGGYLAQHPGIDTVHITGSAVTHDAIVWGTGAEAGERRAAGQPKLTKPITSELGGVAPVIVVPGKWTKRDLAFQAEHVVTMRLHNGGHNCIAGQIVILSADWAQKDAFLAELEAAFARLPERAPWYPGSEAKIARALDAHPDAKRVAGRYLAEVAADGTDEWCTEEAFAPVLGWTQLPGTGTDFFRSAVGYANDHLAGTLGGNIIVQPKDRRAMGIAFEEIVAEFRYGTVAINAWTAVGFLLPAATWGAYPGNTLEDVGSGIGVVHNGHLLADTERTVVTGPFRAFPHSILHGEFSLFPMPPWFVQSRSAAPTGERLTDYAAKPGWGRLAKVLLAAFRA
ncbi:MAG: aldehyde dehydrogenase family protein [Protaetiibacter sp.]